MVALDSRMSLSRTPGISVSRADHNSALNLEETLDAIRNDLRAAS